MCVTNVFWIWRVLQRKHANRPIKTFFLVIEIVWNFMSIHQNIYNPFLKYNKSNVKSNVDTLDVWFNLHDPNDAANKSLNAGFQHNPVISKFFAFSKENFHRGRRVPSVSRYSSDASSQYLKSIVNHLE